MKHRRKFTVWQHRVMSCNEYSVRALANNPHVVFVPQYCHTACQNGSVISETVRNGFVIVETKIYLNVVVNTII